MKYLFKHFLNYILKKKYLYLAYFFLMCLFLLINYNSIKFFDIDFYKCLIGVGKYESGAYLNNLFLLFSCCVIIYYTIYLYLYCIINNIQNILLRMDKFKFMLINTLYIILFIFILSIFNMIPMLGFTCLFKSNYRLFDFLPLFWHSLLFNLLLSFLTILFVNFSVNKKVYFIINLFIIFVVIYSVFIDIGLVNGWILLIVSFIIYILVLLSFNPIRIYNGLGTKKL